MDNLRSTFPLNEAAIARQALGKVLTDPITWVPLVPAVAAYTIFGVPAPFALGFGAFVLGGVGIYWRQQWNGVTESLRRQMIATHNGTQDALLATSVRELQQAGAQPLASKLEQFLTWKKTIEQRLHEDGEITAQKIQLEQLVDSLCFGVRDQLTALALPSAARTPAERQAALAQVDTAFETLRTTAAELDTILGPGEIPGSAAQASLEEITRRLREEAEIARRVQARLRPPEAPPPTTVNPAAENA